MIKTKILTAVGALGVALGSMTLTAPPASAVGCAQTTPSWGYGHVCPSAYNSRLQVAVDDRATDGHCVTATAMGRTLVRSCGPAAAVTLHPGSEGLYLAREWGVRIVRGGSYSTICDGPKAPVNGKPACSSL